MEQTTTRLTPAHCLRLVLSTDALREARRAKARAWEEAWAGQKVRLELVVQRRETEMHAALAAFYAALDYPTGVLTTVLYVGLDGTEHQIDLGVGGQGVYAYITEPIGSPTYDIVVRHAGQEVTA